jgi:hypothetical protein
MFRILKADKDTYITNKYVNSVPAKSGNVGIAGSLDLYKLYGVTQTTSGTTKIPQTELTRLLIHFDLNPLKDLVSAGKIDTTHNSFKCFLNLKDVYGGQTTPNNFDVNIFPLSASFDEGVGKDVAYYSDKDKANFISASKSNSWNKEGCSLACFSTGSGDYITSSITIADTKITQTFITGEEDLLVDVTSIISATLKGDLPDSGFRISFSNDIESNLQTYFVKRFSSRHAYDESKRPKIIVKFDDSISDDTSNLYLDSPISSSLFLYNYVNGQLVNLISSSQEVTGSNSILLELQTEVSGIGNYSLFFTGSQHFYGSNPASGIYSASIKLPLTNESLKTKYLQSGSITFTPIWSSIDRTVSYVTGSVIIANAPNRTTKKLNPQRYIVNVIGINSEYPENVDVSMRVNIFDDNNPIIFAKRKPVHLPGIILRNSYYAIRDIATNEYSIPFDTLANSTKLSSDSDGMYFNINTSALAALKSYVVDIMILVDGQEQKYLNASSPFRIKKL